MFQDSTQKNISALPYFHFQLLAREVKSYIKHTKGFLKKLHSLTNLPKDIILCSVDFVGVYPNILHEDGLSTLQKRLGLKTEKKVSTTTLVKLAELVRKDIAFTFCKKNFEIIRWNSNRN